MEPPDTPKSPIPSQLGSPLRTRSSRTAEVIRSIGKNKGAVAGGIVILLLTLVALTVDLWIDFDTQVAGINMAKRLQSPSLEHPMGTDVLGRDVFHRILYGTRYSLPIGVVAVLISLFIGSVLGVTAGYFGRTVDNVIMRGADIFSSIRACSWASYW